MPRILAIDDDRMITTLLREHFAGEGYEVTTASTAEEGFSSALRSPPDLILLDVVLPDSTGFQMVARFRKHPLTESVPIVMMTGAARFPNQQKIGRDMGANDYILKPFNVVEMGDRVNHLIRERPLSRPQVFRQDPAPRVAAVAVPAVPDTAKENGSSGGVHTLDQQEAVRRLADEISPRPDETNPHSDEAQRTEQPPVQASNSVGGLEPSQNRAAAENRRDETGGGWAPAAWIFSGHLGVSMMLAGDILQAASYTAAGWALFLGLVVAACAVFRLPLEAPSALRIAGWSAVPVIARSVVNLPGFLPDPKALDAAVFWLRPLDVFETAAALILGFSLKRLPGGSLIKSISATLFVALAWSLTSRGYFRP